MNDRGMVAIRTHALRFRNALQKCDKQELPISLWDFPKGSCGDAALLLAQYLTDSQLGTFDYVCGTRHDQDGHRQESHAWLETGDIIVDITADQFDDALDRVLVTSDHSWHGQFQDISKHVADFKNYDCQTRDALLAAYAYVFSLIEK